MEVSITTELVVDGDDSSGKLGVTRANFIVQEGLRKEVSNGIVEFADSFALGVTRSLCIGKSKSGVKIPPLLPERITANTPVQLGIESEEFLVGRDGCWCIWINGKLLQCINFDGITLALSFDLASDTAVETTIEVKLLGNVYQDHVKGSRASDIKRVTVVTNDIEDETCDDKSWMASNFVIPVNVTVG